MITLTEVVSCISVSESEQMQWYLVASLLTILTSSQVFSSLLFSYYQMSSFILTDFPITNQILRLQITAPKYKHLLVPQGILTTLSMTNGRYRYDYATVPFLAEVFKVLFLLSALVFCRVKLKYFTQKE